MLCCLKYDSLNPVDHVSYVLFFMQKNTFTIVASYTSIYTVEFDLDCP